MLSLDMSVFCQDTLTNEAVASCFAHGRDQTYLQWMLNAFGGWLLKGYLTDFGCYKLSWCDGRCVQGPGPYSEVV